jgi:hypothetical protein
MNVINPLTNKEVFHFPSTMLIERKKNADAAIIAIVPTKNVNPT